MIRRSCSGAAGHAAERENKPCSKEELHSQRHQQHTCLRRSALRSRRFGPRVLIAPCVTTRGSLIVVLALVASNEKWSEMRPSMHDASEASSFGWPPSGDDTWFVWGDAGLMKDVQ